MASGVAVFGVLLAALLLHQAAIVLAQKGGLQQTALEAFGQDGGNPTYVDVDSCTTKNTSTNLTCCLMDLVVDPATRVSLHIVNFTICLCGSAISVIYTLSNGTTVTSHSCQQCPFVVQIGQLQLYHNIEVFIINDSAGKNTTTIRLSVNLSSSSASLFGSSDIPLTQQMEDCQNITSPPEECRIQTTAPPPHPITTTTAATTTGADVAPQRRPNAVAIAVPIFIIALVAVIVMTAIFIGYRYKLWVRKREHERIPG